MTKIRETKPTDKFDMSKSLEERNIWCDMMHTNKFLKQCKGCVYQDDCKYREKGALRRVKIDWDKIAIKEK